MIDIHQQPAALSALHEQSALGVYGIFDSRPKLDASPWSSRIDGIEIDPVIADLMMNGGVK